MNIKIQFSILFAALIGAVYFFSAGDEQSGQLSAMPRYQLHEYLEKNDAGDIASGQMVLVMGNIKPGTIKLKGETAEFEITLNNKSMPVYYDGQDGIPDTFKPGAQALLEGKMGKSGIFKAHKIQTKCASKYSQDTVQ